MVTRIIFLVIAFIFIYQISESQTTIVLQPGPEGKDAHVHGYWPDRNLGDDGHIYVWAWTFYGGNPASVRSYIEFNLDFLSPAAVILEAKLSLYYYVAPQDPGVWQYGDNQAYIRRVISDWDEHTITWFNQPLTTDLNAVWIPSSISTNQNYPDIDITELIQDIVADPENSHGLCLRLITEEHYRALCFASSDNANSNLHPKLELTYIDCEPPSVTFNYLITDQTVSFEPVCPSAQSWLWDFGDGYLSTLQYPVHEYFEEGSYEVCLKITDSCGEAEHCEWIDVCDRPVAGFTHSSEELTVYFTDTSQYSVGCFWDFGDGYYSDLQNPWHTYDTSGYYYVCLNTWNVCGADTACRVILIELSDLDEIEVPAISFYPNPAKDFIFIKTDVNGPLNLLLINIQGVSFVNEKLNLGENHGKIDISNISSGLYFIRIFGEGCNWNSKIIIQ